MWGTAFLQWLFMHTLVDCTESSLGKLLGSLQNYVPPGFPQIWMEHYFVFLSKQKWALIFKTQSHLFLQENTLFECLASIYETCPLRQGKDWAFQDCELFVIISFWGSLHLEEQFKWLAFILGVTILCAKKPSEQSSLDILTF